LEQILERRTRKKWNAFEEPVINAGGELCRHKSYGCKHRGTD
jgi:hypothetical protein